MTYDPGAASSAHGSTDARQAPARGPLIARVIEALLAPARRRDARQTVRCLAPHVRASDRVLDLGCGTGITGALLQQEVGCEVVGCDVTPANVALDDFRLFDGDHVPFTPGSFDVVVLAYVLHHVPDPSVVVREAARVARRSIIVFEDTPVTWADHLWGRIHVCGFNGLYRLPPARVRTETAWHYLFSRAGVRLSDHEPIPRLERFPPNARTKFVLMPGSDGEPGGGQR